MATESTGEGDGEVEENSLRGGSEGHGEHGAEGKKFGAQGGNEARCFPEASVHQRVSG